MAGSELYKAALAYHLNLGEYNGLFQPRKYYIAFHSNNSVAEIQHTAKGTIITKQRNSWKTSKVSTNSAVKRNSKFNKDKLKSFSPSQY